MSLLKLIVNDQTNMIFYFFLGLVTGITASLIVFLADKYIKSLLKQSLPKEDDYTCTNKGTTYVEIGNKS